MRWVMALGWILVAGLARAEAPMDLNSPFEKVALVKGRTGELEERTASKAKAVGDKIEFVMTGGGVALFPRSDVVAVLPRFPGSGIIYDLKDVDGAIQLLEALPENLKQRPEATPEMVQKWKDLRKPTEEADAKRKEEEKKREIERIKQDERQVVEWLKEATDFQRARSEAEIFEIREKGQRFLELKVGDERKVRDGMALLTQVVGKEKGGPLPELNKLNEIQPRTTPDDLMIWVAVGILTASFFGLLIGVSYVSSGLTRFKEGAIFGGIVFNGVGLAVLAVLAAIWWPVEGQGVPMELLVSQKMEKVVIFSKNTVKPVYFLPSMEFHVSGHEFANAILGSMQPSEDASGMFKGRLKAGTLWVSKDRWTWKQPITVLGIPLPVTFVFEGKIPSITSWQEISADKVRLGKIVMPSPLAEIFSEAMKGTLQNGLNAGGFSRLQARGGGGDEIVVTTPSSGAKPEVVVKATATSTYRKEITAEDLAKVFMDEKGKEFSGKFIMIEGLVEKVSSGSEVSGGAVATAGSGLGQNQAARAMGAETFDIFYLRGAKSYSYRGDPLLIKCLIKSAQVFVMDSYGDVYTGPQANVLRDKPLIKKGYRVKFLKEGRVESERIQNNEIEVYGIELSGEGDIQVYDPNQPPQN